jgi:hypothetical protein
MQLNKIYRALIIVQTGYYFLTALWGLIDIDSFMQVTGRKTDIWLVKTVSVLLLPICLCLFLSLFFKPHPLLVICVALSSCIGLASIDFYYTSNGTIKWIYKIDGFVQLFFLISWSILLVRIKSIPH